MASNIYQRTTVTGTTWHTRKGTQGAPKKPEELKKVYKTYTMTKQSQPIIKANALKMGMSISAYVELAVRAQIFQSGTQARARHTISPRMGNRIAKLALSRLWNVSRGPNRQEHSAWKYQLE